MYCSVQLLKCIAIRIDLQGGIAKRFPIDQRALPPDRFRRIQLQKCLCAASQSGVGLRNLEEWWV